MGTIVRPPYHGPIRDTGFARRGGETHEFTKRREKSRAKSKAARAARKRAR
jgi:hypothetical protein